MSTRYDDPDRTPPRGFPVGGPGRRRTGTPLPGDPDRWAEAEAAEPVPRAARPYVTGAPRPRSGDDPGTRAFDPFDGGASAAGSPGIAGAPGPLPPGTAAVPGPFPPAGPPGATRERGPVPPGTAAVPGPFPPAGPPGTTRERGPVEPDRDAFTGDVLDPAPADAFGTRSDHDPHTTRDGWSVAPAVIGGELPETPPPAPAPEPPPPAADSTKRGLFGRLFGRST
ncbi:hypothetical protein [Saccharothrix obliqua]|uniref:hypothetical protein n=1 Tax=Saccharothrix obliqua TaxID=2861747 RepID=UPI001C5E26B2|nr:hypothetical protein [Saccharothrix obliqua]MBW4720091.1 hypothetical protein [Saccharothrix obliqua]